MSEARGQGMRSLEEWLRGVGLERYGSAFAENDIDFSVVRKLTDSDLRELGLTLGHRKKFFEALATLDFQTEPTPATAPTQPEPEPPSATIEPSGERRQLTVMFCDLVGSTALSARMDPEELRALLHEYRMLCGEVIARYDGLVARYVGDGVLTYFGWPKAHEEDAERSVRAALEIVQAMKRMSFAEPLSVKIGIATGLVVVGDQAGEGDQAKLAVGATPNLAARLQSEAGPDCVLIAESSHRLVEGLFECDELGPMHFKGISEPVVVYRVRRESGAPSRFEAGAQRGLTPIIGREEEIAYLLKRWAQAKEGEAPVLLIEGEAGIGKSRLLRSFCDRLEGELHSRLLYYGSAYHQSSAFYPAIDQLERALRFEREDGPQRKLQKLESMLAELGLDVAAHAPSLVSFLSLPTKGRYAETKLAPDQRKRQFLETFAAMVKAMAQRQPVLMVVEDMHVMDPSTIELLTLLVEEFRSGRFFLVAAFRPGFWPPWTRGGNVTSLTLGRLSRKESAAMIGKVTGGKALPDEVFRDILTKTDGVPLFVEELTKMVLESNLLERSDDGYRLSSALLDLAIPTSLQDSLMARLDRLATTKELAQLGATLGRTFSHELLAAVAQLDEAKLDAALGQLVTAELLYRHGQPPEVTYEFKHALVRDAAYHSLLKSTRQLYHGRIAQALEERFSGIAETQPELVAHHYTEAKIADRAITFWIRAGQRAVACSANVEAIDHFRKALDLLQMLPDTSARTQQELQIRIALAVPLTATSGYGAAEVEHTYSRARELCEQLGSTSELFPTLYGMWRYHLLRAQCAAAREVAQKLLSFAESAQEPVFLMASHRALGATFFYGGELIEAQEHLETARSLYASHGDLGLALMQTYDVVDPQVASLSYASWVFWLRGYPERAWALSKDAVSLAQKRAHPFSLVLALSFSAWLHQFCRDPDQASARAQNALELATECGFPFWIGWNEILESWARGETKPGEDEAARIRQGLVSWRAQGSELGTTYFLALLAEAHARSGQIDAGLEVLAEAQSMSDKTGERFWLAEQLRLRGELLIRRGAPFRSEAEACFQQSLEVARRQQAKSLELRAATSLGRFWRSDGKLAEARTVLSEACDWFKGGLSTADLTDARALLQELSA